MVNSALACAVSSSALLVFVSADGDGYSPGYPALVQPTIFLSNLLPDMPDRRSCRSDHRDRYRCHWLPSFFAIAHCRAARFRSALGQRDPFLQRSLRLSHDAAGQLSTEIDCPRLTVTSHGLQPPPARPPLRRGLLLSMTTWRNSCRRPMQKQPGIQVLPCGRNP